MDSNVNPHCPRDGTLCAPSGDSHCVACNDDHGSMGHKTYAQIVEQRQREARQRQKEAQAWAVKVSEELANQRSKFMLEFTNDEKRIFGVFE